jgi:hypothetical protein
MCRSAPVPGRSKAEIEHGSDSSELEHADIAAPADGRTPTLTTCEQPADIPIYDVSCNICSVLLLRWVYE